MAHGFYRRPCEREALREAGRAVKEIRTERYGIKNPSNISDCKMQNKKFPPNHSY